MPLQRYGTGFLKGLTNVAQQAKTDLRDKEDTESRNNLAMAQLALQSGDPVLIQGALDRLTDDFGGGKPRAGGKKGAGGAADPKSMIAQLLIGGLDRDEGSGAAQDPLRLSTPQETATREQTKASAATEGLVARMRELVSPDGTPMFTTEQIAAAVGGQLGVPAPTVQFAPGGSTVFRDGEQGATLPATALQNRMQSVPGEIPDGAGGFTPAFGRFDRTTGEYVGEDGTVLPDFRPRTTTGSRSLGTEREALALEMFGSTASQLTREQIAIINRMLPERAGTLAEARGLGTGAARIETELNMPLSEAEVARQDVPFGTTMRDLIGFEPVTPGQRARKAAVTSLAPQLTQIRELIGTVFPTASGLTGALTASAVLAQKRASRDPGMASLVAAINLAIGNVARVLAAESGRLTEQDAERARSALADLQGFTDTRESALAKITQAERAMAIIARSIQTPGEQLREREGGSVQFQGQTYNFDSQAQADLWLRGAEAEAAGR